MTKDKNIKNKKLISIFGSTGSIGKNVIKIINDNRDRYEILALTGNNNVDLLIKQARLLKPKIAIIANNSLYFALQKGVEGYDINTMSGEQALQQTASIKCDTFVSAISGYSAIRPTLNAIKAGSNIALANKECLTVAGHLCNAEAKKNGVNIIPIDETHNAIFQCLEKGNHDKIEEVVITTSGGPFKNFKIEEMKNIKPEQAITYPNWTVNKKISVDSATMMNKGLQIIEAHHLFNLSPDKIKIIVHPERIIRGMVNYIDGSTKALLHHSDIKIPICDSINYPERILTKHKYLDLTEIKHLTFEKINSNQFPAVDLCMNALREGGNMPCTLNTTNEVAVNAFLQNEIRFLDIYLVVFDVMNKTYKQKISTIEDIFECDRKARELTLEVLAKYKR
jgi:1-deoxy-D-xylulose-5-phosphate reductoisomerase